MPLAADEAYYRVWAHALAPGYLDHPPMVALWIRAGVGLLGETPLGVRLFSPIGALLGSLLLVRAGEDLAPEQGTGWRAAWLLNATLLLNAGAVTATPDTPLLLFWTASLAALARLLRTGNGKWWLAAGVAAGLGFDSKYTAALLAPALLLWVVVVPELRGWLRRWQPYAAATIAVLLTLPTLAWNAHHGWASVVRQGGRTAAWHPAAALSHIGELVAGQVGLATPLLFVVFVAGFVGVRRDGGWRRPGPGLLLATALVPTAVFLEHALGDRVQANWPAIVYPGAALAAAIACPPWRRAAMSLGMALSAIVVAQAAFAPFALPRRVDFSLIRLAGWRDLAVQAEFLRRASGIDCVASDDYGVAAELAWYATAPVLGAEPRWRYFALPPAPANCRSVLLVRSTRRAGPPPRAIWGDPTPAGVGIRARDGIVAETYSFYRADTPPGAVLLPARD